MPASRVSLLLMFLCSLALSATPQAASREELDAFGLAYDAPDPFQTIKACESFLSHYPKSAFGGKIWQLEFEAFILRGDSAAALRVGRSIIALDPRQAEILTKLAVLAASSPDPTERERAAAYASRALEEVAAMHRPEEMPRARYIVWKREIAARAHATLGELALRRDAPAVAVREFKSAISLVPAQAEYWKFLGVAHLQLKQYREACTAFEEALTRLPDLPGVRLLLGTARFYERNFKASEASLVSVVAQNPPPREAFLYLMRDYVALDSLNLDVAERAAAAFPHDAELLFETGQAALDHVRSLARQANNLGRESREFEELEARKHGDTLVPPVSSLAAEYDRTAALVTQCYQTVLEEAPNSSYGQRVRGYSAESQNQVDEALADYRAGGDHFAAGRLLAQNARYDEAAIEFKAELSARPDNHLALAQLSQLYVQLDQPGLARPIIDQLLLLYPADAYAWLDRGRIEQKGGQWQEAAASFKKALSIDPSLTQARYRLATVYQHLGENASAAEELQRFQAGREKKP
jgi:tetratricopeptide (TPR) repeat protein